MTYSIRLVAFIAILASVLAATATTQAGNRKAFKSLVAEAEAYCAEIMKSEVYKCSVEKCPCADGLREVKRFDKLRTRPACVCTPDTGRKGENQADANDFCIDWNHHNAREGDRCFVTAGGCPSGTKELAVFAALRGRGPEQAACRGAPPEEEEEEKEAAEGGR